MSFEHSKVPINSVLNTELGKKWFPNKLVRDYISGNDISDIYTHLPDLATFPKAIKAKENKKIDRKLLVEVLTSQYSNCSSLSTGIKKLEKENCFTVTTGHQLSVFTGPLYFIYKILSAINLSESLKSAYPNFDFVPIFWMASEDHDFEEINHINVYGKKIEWKDFQGGAVGRYTLEGIKEIYSSLSDIINGDKAIEFIYTAYKKNKTLADATRDIVHQLFGKYGLVVIDGDDKRFKAQFSGVLKDELKGISNDLIEDFSSKIKKHYPIQAKSRPINLFYLQNRSRDRIINIDNGLFGLVDKDIEWTEDQLNELIEKQPDSFSPNVLLRPLYQETLLPNIAYVGGPGELAYWFQLKTLFLHYKQPFPVLIPRKSVIVMEKKVAEKIQTFNINSLDLYKDEAVLLKKIIKEKIGLHLDNERDLLERIVDEVMLKVKNTDPSLEGAVYAEKAKWVKGLEKIESKLFKAEKRNHESTVNQLIKLKEKLYPNQSFQERYDTILPYLSKYGIGFIDILKGFIDPLEKDIVLIEEV